jgi:hypothetical protein
LCKVWLSERFFFFALKFWGQVVLGGWDRFDWLFANWAAKFIDW